MSPELIHCKNLVIVLATLWRATLQAEEVVVMCGFVWYQILIGPDHLKTILVTFVRPLQLHFETLLPHCKFISVKVLLSG